MRDSKRGTKIKGMNYSSGKDHWKKFEKNNVTIALHIFYSKEKLYPANVSKHTQIVKNIIRLMIPSGEG